MATEVSFEYMGQKYFLGRVYKPKGSPSTESDRDKFELSSVGFKDNKLCFRCEFLDSDRVVHLAIHHITSYELDTWCGRFNQACTVAGGGVCGALDFCLRMREREGRDTIGKDA